MAGQPTALALHAVRIPAAQIQLDGDLSLPPEPRGLVVFAHGSGSSRHSVRNRWVARELNAGGLATLLLDLLTPAEDVDGAERFDIERLSARLAAAVDWARGQAQLRILPIGLFGASTGAAAAITVAAAQPGSVAAVVSRGGRPDLADHRSLRALTAPTLLIVGGDDIEVLRLNQAAQAQMRAVAEIAVIPGASHLFPEPGALEQVAVLAARWYQRWLPAVP